MTFARFVFAVSFFVPLAAQAQDPPARGHRPRVIEIAPTVIEGRAQRPVFVVLRRANIDHSGLERHTSFVREIVRDAPP